MSEDNLPGQGGNQPANSEAGNVDAKTSQCMCSRLSEPIQQICKVSVMVMQIQTCDHHTR